MKSNLKKTVVLVVILAFVGIQFIPVDRSNPKSDGTSDFISSNQIDGEVGSLLKQACYDCHSNKTTYPWYSYVAPVSFVIADHVKEGRSELNFSEWGTYSDKKKNHKLEECVDALREKWMPLKGYLWLHREANLTDQQRDLVASRIEEIMKMQGSSESVEGGEQEHDEEDEHDH